MKEDLIFKYFEGKANKEEQEQIFKWLDEDKNNKRTFARLKQLYVEIISSLDDNKNDDILKSYNNLLKRVEYFEQQKESERKAKIIKLKNDILKWAAIIILVFLVGSFSYFLGKRSYTTPEKYCEINVPLGSRTQVTLPDGSKVWLNAGSTLKYNQDFLKDKRIVYLDGEAYFEVVKYNNIPFYVNTSHLNITVLGTKFNVRSYSDDKTIETTLVEGKVKVIGKNSNYSLILKPNQRLVIDKENLKLTMKNIENEKTDIINENKSSENKVESNIQQNIKYVEIQDNVNVYEDTGWKDGILVINQEPLESLVKKLERKYDIKFIFEDEELKKYTYTGTLKDYPLEQILKAIRLTSPVNYNINEKTVRLFKK